MIRSRRSRWLSGIGAVVLIGGLVLANSGSGVTPAEATITLVNPFPIIIDKLNQILAKLSTSPGGNHTLRWDSNNASATCFTTAFPGEVLDNNTGLVWEQAPAITGGSSSNGTRSWAAQTSTCVNKIVGGTKGWRLPSVVELVSLIDTSLPAPFVPTTVFTGVQLANYWSATSNAVIPDDAWIVGFDPKSSLRPAWCVRGGMNADQC